MKNNLKELLIPITNWYTGTTAVEQSSLSKFTKLESQLEELKLFLEIMFDSDDIGDNFKSNEIQAIRHFYRHVDEMDLWHVLTNPKSVKTIATNENAELKKLKAMAKELLDVLKGKVV